MLNLHLNLDDAQPVKFANTDALRKKFLANPFLFDGLCLFEDGETVCEITYDEVYLGWETSEAGGHIDHEPYSHDSIEDAIDEFIDLLNTNQ